MTIMLGYETLKGALKMSDAIDLLEQALSHEAAGKTVVAPRTHVDFDGGTMRILLAIDHQAGYFAMKAYNRMKGVGVRYVVSLYRLRDGELVAFLDARLITDLRTGAASGVCARKVPVEGPVSIGIIGSGNQARSQLVSLAASYRAVSVAVYSPTPEHRAAYAREMSAQLGVPVTPVDTAEAAVRGRNVVAVATRARGSEPVLRGEWLDRCRLLCAVGNTRKQFSEADVRCFQDAALVVVDTLHAFEATGELIQAAKSGAVPEHKRATLAQLTSGAASVPRDGMVVFKSTGTALQDLALAVRYYELLGTRPGLPSAPDTGSVR